jgi:hypothetical protein
MKNIHLLPTDKPSRLGQVYEKLSFFKDRTWDNTENWRCKNIYITNSEEIKEGDWFYNIISLKPEPFKACENGDGYVNCNRYSHYRIDCKKIILSTDQDLIKDGIQAIDDGFLEWFVKNPSCESVEVETTRERNGYHSKHKKRYKIIIPKEPKQGNNFYEELKHYFETTPREKVLKDWDESAELDKIGPTVEEFLGMIQETIEEAADLWATDTKNVHPADSYIAKQSFIQGAKSQQEQDKNKYSEEEVYKLLLKHQSDYRSSVRNSYPLTWSFDIKNWFEQFKKK